MYIQVSPANGPFAIDGNKLVAKTVATSNLDSEAGVTSVVVIINSTDNHGYSVQRTFTICIKRELHIKISVLHNA